ncbi:MAG TPA: PEFG-CTERM sorting domain-containing protein [Nitrosopumilaceae archaeon]|nr:PEFG-CTERM sorting domain-containing protein [Nitrosopumilaceae archaeon]
MSTHKEYALIAILATAAVMGAIPAFAADELPCPDCFGREDDAQLIPVSVWTDKAVYNQPNMIQVGGHVKDPNPNFDLTLKVVGPTGNIVKVDQITVDDNGDFETTLSTASPLWTKSGVYTISVQYGTIGRSNEVQVEIFTGGVCGESELAVKAGIETYCIPYSVTGAIVKSGMIDMNSKSLIVRIDADSDGDITLDIPRSVLDSKSGNNDSRFFVLVNGEEEDIYSESKTDDTRSVTIQFESGVDEIEIIGTFVVPEFGAIAALVLAVAIISIIALSAKTRLRLMPKY